MSATSRYCLPTASGLSRVSDKQEQTQVGGGTASQYDYDTDPLPPLYVNHLAKSLLHMEQIQTTANTTAAMNNNNNEQDTTGYIQLNTMLHNTPVSTHPPSPILAPTQDTPSPLLTVPPPSANTSPFSSHNTQLQQATQQELMNAIPHIHNPHTLAQSAPQIPLLAEDSNRDADDYKTHSSHTLFANTSVAASRGSSAAAASSRDHGDGLAWSTADKIEDLFYPLDKHHEDETDRPPRGFHLHKQQHNKQTASRGGNTSSSNNLYATKARHGASEYKHDTDELDEKLAHQQHDLRLALREQERAAKQREVEREAALEAAKKQAEEDKQAAERLKLLQLLCYMYRCRECMPTYKDREERALGIDTHEYSALKLQEHCCIGHALSSAFPASLPLDLLPITQGYLLLTPSRSFLTHPPPPSAGVIQCYILKQNNKFELFMEIRDHADFQSVRKKMVEKQDVEIKQGKTSEEKDRERSELMEMLFRERQQWRKMMNQGSATTMTTNVSPPGTAPPNSPVVGSPPSSPTNSSGSKGKGHILRSLQERMTENNQKSMLLSHAEHLIMSAEDIFLLAATRKRAWTGNSYMISSDREIMKVDHPSFIGKLKSNFGGTEFVMYDQGVKNSKKSRSSAVTPIVDNHHTSSLHHHHNHSPNTPPSAHSYTSSGSAAQQSSQILGTKYNRECGVILYDHFFEHTGSPIRIKILLPNRSFYTMEGSQASGSVMKQWKAETKDKEKQEAESQKTRHVSDHQTQQQQHPGALAVTVVEEDDEAEDSGTSSIIAPPTTPTSSHNRHHHNTTTAGQSHSPGDQLNTTPHSNPQAAAAISASPPSLPSTPTAPALPTNTSGTPSTPPTNTNASSSSKSKSTPSNKKVPLPVSELDEYEYQTPGQHIEQFENLRPVWHDGMNAYVLHFDHHRVREKSVKNFKLIRVNDTEEKKTVLQFGRVLDRNVFVMDFAWPLSAFQAFAICLSSIDPKIAV